MPVFLTAASVALLAPILLVSFSPELANVKLWLGVVTLLGGVAVVRRRTLLLPALMSGVSRRQLGMLSAAALLLFLAKGATDFGAFKLSGLDFSIFDQMLYNTAHGRFMWTTMCDCNHFAVHPTYVLLPLVPIYALAPSPWILIVLHAVVAWAGVIPLWRLARHYLPGDGLAALVLLAYVANPWVGSIVGYGFHVEVFYLPAGLWFIWGWISKRPAIWATSLVVFLAVKEDAALYTGSFAAYVAMADRERRQAALGVLMTSVAVFAGNVFFVQPYFRPPETQPGYLSFWGHYGDNLGAIVTTMATNPWRVALDVLSSKWYVLFGSALFLPFLSRAAVAAMLPAIFLLGTSATPPMRNYGLYYSAPLLPFFFWGLVAAYAQLAKQFDTKRAAIGIAIAATLLSFTRNGSIILAPTKVAVAEDVKQVSKAHTTHQGPVCAQLALVPHLPYDWDVRPLTPACAGTQRAVTIGHPDLSPYPYDPATLAQLLAGSQQHPSGLMTRGW